MEKPLGPGSAIGGFRIEEVLGRGAMGTVYRARGQAGELVAIKVLSGDDAQDLVFRERFRREAQTAAKLDHPGIVRCFGSGEHGRSLWIALELMTGGSLADRLVRAGTLPWREATAIAADIAQALAALHAAGTVHRDLKPANVLLDANGRPKLTDFGISRDRTGKGQALTRTGEILGTPNYVAPEQIDAAKTVDGQADLYSLGIIIHELVAGSPPFKGANSLEVMKAHLSAEAPPLGKRADVPASLEAVTARLLEKEPSRRGAGAGAIARELDAIAKSDDKSRRIVVVMGAVLALLGVALVALVLTLGAGRAAPPASPVSPMPPPPGPAVTKTRPDRGSGATAAGPAIPETFRALDCGKSRLVAAFGGGAASSPQSLAVSGDGALAALGDDAGQVHLWEIETRTRRWSHGAPASPPVFGVVVTDGHRVVACSQTHSDQAPDCMLLSWDEQGEHASMDRLPKGRFADVRAVALTPDGSKVFLGGKIEGGGGLACLVDATSLEIVDEFPLPGPGNAIYAVAVSPDGDAMLAALKNEIEVLARRQPRPLKTIGNGYPSRRVAFLDEHRIVDGSGEGSVRVWSIPDGDEVGATKVGTKPRALATSAATGNGLIAAATEDGKIHVVRGDPSMQGVDVIDLSPVHDKAVALAFMPRGDELLAATEKGWILRLALPQ